MNVMNAFECVSLWPKVYELGSNGYLVMETEIYGSDC